MAWYVVYRGRVPGVYSSWAMCATQVSGYPNNSHMSFPTREEAEASYLEYTGGDNVPLFDNAAPPVPFLDIDAQPVPLLHNAPTPVAGGYHGPLLVLVAICLVLIVGLLVLIVCLILRI